MKTLAIAVASWGANRLDIFGLGTDNHMYHKAWNGSIWQPSTTDWETIGGTFVSVPAVVSSGPNRLDIFGLGTDNAMYHKAWNGSAWQPLGFGWEFLGGRFYSPPAVVSSGPNRLDVFGLGAYNVLYHKAWNPSGWQPSAPGVWDALGGNFTSAPAVASSAAGTFDIFCVGPDGQMYHVAWNGNFPLPLITGWDHLGGNFESPPVVVSSGPNRLDIFCVNIDNQLFHKALNGGAWLPSLTGWDDLGIHFDSPPAVASSGPNRLDIFCLGTDDEVLHLAWNGSSPLPSITDWDHLGGGFDSSAAVASWGSNRLDIFGLGTDNAMYHKAWNGSIWQPSKTGWELLGEPPGGGFNIPTPESAGVGGTYNYILSNNCNSLIDVSVTIYITQDLVYASQGPGRPPGSTTGFSFQLNAYSSNKQNAVGWQQYVISVEGNQLNAVVNNWPPSGPPIINTNSDPKVLASLSGPRLPAGYMLTISLQNDNSGNVIEATYVVIDNQGNELPVQQIMLAPLGPVAPIVAFELDIVGPVESEEVLLSSGAGTITYSAASVLAPSNQVPGCAVSGSTNTYEDANTFYGTLPIGISSNTFTHFFNVSNDDTPAPPPSPTPQLNANPTSNESGYDIGFSGTGFPPERNVSLYLVGVTGRPAPLGIGSTVADANGNISGNYPYTGAQSSNVILQAQLGSTIFASTTGFYIN